MALELDNFRVAMDFTQGKGEWKLLGELGVALSRFFYIRGLWSEGIQRLRQASEALRRLKENALLAKALNGLGRFYQYQGDCETARNLYTESLQIRRELGDKWGIAESLHQFGKLAKADGELAQAVRFLLAAARLYEEMKAANSKDAVEVGEALAGIQKEIGAEQFERMKEQAETMSIEQVIDLALD